MDSVSAEKRVADLSALLEVSKAMMTVQKDLDALLDLIVERTTGVMTAERTSLYLLDHETQELWTRTAEGLEIEEIRVPIGKGICGHVAADSELVNVHDAYSDPRFDASWDKRTDYRTRNVLCAPLLTHEDRVVGVVEVLNKKGGQFTKYDESVLLGLASHAAVAIEQSELIRRYLEEKKAAAGHELARDIQASLLGAESPWTPRFDVYGHCWPCDDTAGDYYDFIELPDSSLGIAVGDVTGHGVGPALLMTGARAVLRAIASAESDVREVACRVNDMLASDAKEGMFMTLLYAALDIEARTVTYISAGHEPGLIYRADTGEIELMESAVPPMGILEGIVFPPPQTASLNTGDVLFLCTDGAAEAANADGSLFGRPRLHQVLQANAHRPAQEIATRVNEEIRAFCGDAPMTDDVTMVVVKAEPVTSWERQDGDGSTPQVLASRVFEQRAPALANVGASAAPVGH